MLARRVKIKFGTLETISQTVPLFVNVAFMQVCIVTLPFSSLSTFIHPCLFSVLLSTILTLLSVQSHYHFICLAHGDYILQLEDIHTHINTK